MRNDKRVENRSFNSIRTWEIYCLQVDMALVDYEHLEALMDGLNQQNIKLVVIDKNMNFVSVPEGYEVVKKEGK